jgi:hypothetical protein
MEKIRSTRRGNIWLNVFKTDDNQLLITVSKSFLNKDGQWERTPFLNPRRGDIRDLMDALLEFHEFEKMLDGWAQRARPFSLHFSSQLYD